MVFFDKGSPSLLNICITLCHSCDLVSPWNTGRCKTLHLCVSTVRFRRQHITPVSPVLRQRGEMARLEGFHRSGYKTQGMWMLCPWAVASDYSRLFCIIDAVFRRTLEIFLLRFFFFFFNKWGSGMCSGLVMPPTVHKTLAAALLPTQTHRLLPYPAFKSMFSKVSSSTFSNTNSVFQETLLL